MSAKHSTIHHAHLWGTREAKAAWLSAHDIRSTEWRELRPSPSLYLFVPRDERLAHTYEAFPSLPKLFPMNSVGIVTARDHLTIHWNPEDAWRTVLAFSRIDPELARTGYKLGKDAKDWKVAWAQKDLLDSGPSRDNIVPILYRPFDIRYTYYTGNSSGFHCRPRPEVMRHMLQDNLALLAPRRVEHIGEWQHTFVCTALSDHVAVSLKTIDYHFPLYACPAALDRDMFAHLDPSHRQANLHKALLPALAGAFGREAEPEQVFNYIYGVLYAPTYRERYAELLRVDFPRVPFTRDAELFGKVAALGGRLVELHLLRSRELHPPSARFEGKGDSKVAKGAKAGVRYDPQAQRVYINATQHFAPVAQEVWDYRVGGYQVCDKWLKDRRERTLSVEEIRTYCRIVTALGKTIGIQQALDELYPAIEESLLPLDLGS